MSEIQYLINAAYEKGFLDGIKTYSWMKDGIFYVGTTGKTLRDAEKDINSHWNFNPPSEEELNNEDPS